MKFSRTLALLLLLFAVYWSFKSLMPSYSPDQDVELKAFSTDRALEHVKQLSMEPHAVGFPGHERAKDYIISELNQLGLTTTVQDGYTAGDWGNLSKATNILARIEGSGDGKALLLLSHYDSNPHSSLGASDAGSGVATILEGVRAFLSENRTPKNDIIILISDAEELGLNGADLFVNKHPWAKDVGLVLNFEARGSGGPSYMLIETNRGNAKLIKNSKRPIQNIPWPIPWPTVSTKCSRTIQTLLFLGRTAISKASILHLSTTILITILHWTTTKDWTGTLLPTKAAT